MKVGVPRETAAGERRVALVPETDKRLAGGGFEVAVERGAGEAASFPDPDYEQAGSRRLCDGIDPQDHQGAGDGRAFLAGDGVRLQGGSPRRRPLAEVLPD